MKELKLNNATEAEYTYLVEEVAALFVIVLHLRSKWNELNSENQRYWVRLDEYKSFRNVFLDAMGRIVADARLRTEPIPWLSR